MEKKLFFITLLFITFSMNLPFVKSEGVSIEMQDTFTTGDIINFNYTIEFDYDALVEYFYNIHCDDLPDALLDIKRVQTTNEKITGNFEGMKVEKNYQNCFAFVSVISPFNLEAKKSFSINSLLDIPLQLALAKKIFTKGETINLDYSSSVSDLNVDTTLTNPNGDSDEIDLPYNFVASEIGTYNLEVTASKEGYKEISLSEQFGVIEKDAEIQTTGRASSSLDLGEDITIYESFKENIELSRWTYVVIALVLVFFVVVFFLLPTESSSREVISSS
ncbi:MAG: hypothetical protein KKB79_02730 [Nanoarchaeota archaeon]|nr:hypothetical protein [Nanoarchaeota archaeon]